MQIENLKLMNENGKPLYLSLVSTEDGKVDEEKSVEATTLGLLRQIVNQPQQAGTNQNGTPIVGYENMDEFQQGATIYKKLNTAFNLAPEGDKAGKTIGNFELSPKEFEFCKKLVKNYKNLYQAVSWAPFVEQFFPNE